MANNLAFPEKAQFEELVQDGIQAVKAGQGELGRRLLQRATLIYTGDARPWLWLSATTDDPAEQRDYLEKAVAAEPGNAQARRGLVTLSDKLDRRRLLQEGEPVQPRPTLVDAQTRSHLCPQCGAKLRFDLGRHGLACDHCGYLKATEASATLDPSEQVMDFVLPTTRAHVWAQAQQRVACERCGAVVLLPSGQVVHICPYCGANQWLQSPELAELADPQGIGLLKIDARQAALQVKTWLGSSFFAPDDLSARSKRLSLRAGYYPFWAFNGTLSAPWHCQVNEGTSKSPRWVARSGTAFDFFDDVLVPGIHSMTMEELAGVEPFDLKGLMAFNPEYLAGWPAMTYNRSLANASLLGREKVVHKLKEKARNEVVYGRDVRDFSLGGGEWSGQTFKYVLLPLWVGTYTYNGQLYRIVVNGQSGKVGGKRPVDWVKVWLTAILALFLAMGGLYGLYWLLSK